jgi:parallel beta-helix repeat protein
MKHHNYSLKIQGRSISAIPGNFRLSLFLLCTSFIAISSCELESDCNENTICINQEMTISQIQEALISVPDNYTIQFAAGLYDFTTHLTLDGKSNITIQGVGADRTKLLFENQTEGGEGILVTNCNGFKISDLSILEAKGDGIKVKDSDGVHFSGIEARWEEEKSPDNGAYGIYPVLSKNILIEDCYAKGSVDAGIYVGQSQNAIIRGCKVEKNVVGIEVENTIGADIYDNEAINNTAGILVLDLQNLVHGGEKTRVFNNILVDNNYDNFAEPGTIVAVTPVGTGILILASREVEVFDNVIGDNNVIGIGIVSYISISVLTGEPITAPDFDPYFDNVYVHDNSFSKNDEINVTGQSDLGLLLLSKFGASPIPHIVTDGIFKEGTGDNGGICINNNEGASFVNLDIANNFANPSFDITPHLCEGQVLSPINL